MVLLSVCNTDLTRMQPILGAVAATATVLAPILLPTASTVVTTGVTFGLASIGGVFVDYTTQLISHNISEDADTPFVVDEERLLKTGISTGVAGIIPTAGKPSASIANAVGSLAMGFDATFINSVIDIILGKLFK